MKIPTPRGDLGRAVVAALSDPRADARDVTPSGREDADLALWMLHELHYRGFEDATRVPSGTPACWRSAPAWRRSSRSACGPGSPACPRTSGDLATAIFEVIEKFEGASVSGFVHRHATTEQVLHLMRVRSMYHLKEADPSAFVLPRLSGAAQAGLAELLYDEYGGGRAERLHSGLFARGLADAGLDPAYGAYVDEVPAEVLEQNNALTMFGLHGRLRAAAMGHLAAFEATSSLPSRRMAQGLRRLELPESLAHYYDEHVEADAVHEQVAVRAICVPMVEAEPHLREDLFLGVFTCLDQEDRVARHLLATWEAA